MCNPQIQIYVFNKLIERMAFLRLLFFFSKCNMLGEKLAIRKDVKQQAEFKRISEEQITNSFENRVNKSKVHIKFTEKMNQD